MEISNAGEGQWGAAGPSTPDHDTTLSSLRSPASSKKISSQHLRHPHFLQALSSCIIHDHSRDGPYAPMPTSQAAGRCLGVVRQQGPGFFAFILTQPCTTAGAEHLHLRGWSHTPFLAAKELLLSAGESSAEGRRCPRWCLNPFLGP